VAILPGAYKLKCLISPADLRARAAEPLSVYYSPVNYMKYLRASKPLTLILLTVFSFAPSSAQKRAAASAISETNVRAEMYFLAGDAMQGRGSGSQFERIAAEYIGSQFMQFRLEPAGDAGFDGKPTYVQTVRVPGREVLKELRLGVEGVNLVYGRDFASFGVNAKEISGPLQRVKAGEAAAKGAIVLLAVDPNARFQDFQQSLAKLRQDGAAAIIVTEIKEARDRWPEIVANPVSVSRRGTNLFMLTAQATETFGKVAEGAKVTFAAESAPATDTFTWNAIGKLTGSDETLSPEVILLSSHLDHLGVRPNNAGDDKIFNGADDDASGSVAVLEMARVLASGKRPKRTVYFVCFGSEEAGGFGANYFVNNLPFPKEKLVANLEFEMIGRPDAKVKPDELWLTGYERSNLGPELAKRGAKLVQDPHPDQNFFQRSDNYTLARQGVIAHTVSSFGLHPDYHRASDEVRTIDFAHMTRAINSMVSPVIWLVNSNFIPAWNDGKRP
jgi:hypothetical protein